MNARSVDAIGTSIIRPGNGRFSAANISSSSLGRDLDPVVAIDHFEIREPTFPPHPHAGFSAVTYLFEDSQGPFMSRDSTGTSVVVEPGSVIWNMTGRGVLHEEFPLEPNVPSRGLQLFVNSSANLKTEPPQLFVARPSEIPIISEGGARIRVVTGEVHGISGAISPPGQVNLLDVSLAPNANYNIRLPREHSVLVYIVKGSASVDETTRFYTERSAFSLSNDGDFVRLTSEVGAQLIVIAGPPLKEPVVARGPFIMNTEAEIEDAFQRYRDGAMGTLSPFHHKQESSK